MKKTILLVDDSISVRNVASIAIRAAGYELLLAEDGKQAMNMLNGQKIHLIISDVDMPHMNGLEFLANVKQTTDYKFTPVMMLTTRKGQEEKLQAKDTGARAWMAKPFQTPQLLEAISKIISA